MRKFACRERLFHERYSRMARSLGFQHNGKHLFAFGCQAKKQYRSLHVGLTLTMLEKVLEILHSGTFQEKEKKP